MTGVINAIPQMQAWLPWPAWSNTSIQTWPIIPLCKNMQIARALAQLPFWSKINIFMHAVTCTLTSPSAHTTRYIPVVAVCNHHQFWTHPVSSFSVHKTKRFWMHNSVEYSAPNPFHIQLTWVGYTTSGWAGVAFFRLFRNFCVMFLPSGVHSSTSPVCRLYFVPS